MNAWCNPPPHQQRAQVTDAFQYSTSSFSDHSMPVRYTIHHHDTDMWLHNMHKTHVSCRGKLRTDARRMNSCMAAWAYTNNESKGVKRDKNHVLFFQHKSSHSWINTLKLTSCVKPNQICRLVLLQRWCKLFTVQHARTRNERSKKSRYKEFEGTPASWWICSCES